jgi:hypothetical protein
VVVDLVAEEELGKQGLPNGVEFARREIGRRVRRDDGHPLLRLLDVQSGRAVGNRFLDVEDSPPPRAPTEQMLWPLPDPIPPQVGEAYNVIVAFCQPDPFATRSGGDWALVSSGLPAGEPGKHRILKAFVRRWQSSPRTGCATSA